jgi:hypothetical protein
VGSKRPERLLAPDEVEVERPTSRRRRRRRLSKLTRSGIPGRPSRRRGNSGA